ncbi:MAG: hypothetical protein GY765_23530, partial [bacterium]|nr:hypothetical protein [bacterium]
MLWKYNSHGQPDTSFNGSGFVRFYFPEYVESKATAYGLVLDNAGRPVLCGLVKTGSDDDSYEMFVIRYNTDGTLDTGFNHKGYLVFENPGRDYGREVLITPEGKIIIAGGMFNGADLDMAVWRFHDNGSPDTSFNGSGYAVHHNAAGGNGDDLAQALALDSRGRMIIGGSSLSSDGDTDDAVVWRYATDGEPDLDFNGVGFCKTGYTGDGYSFHDIVLDLALDSDENIIFFGYTRYKNGSSLGSKTIYVDRLNPDGAHDTACNNGSGIFFFHTDEGYSGMAYSLLVAEDNTIFASGTVDYSGNSDSLIFKLQAGGTLDKSFNGCGYQTTHNIAGGDGHDRISAIGITGTGSIIGAGFSSNGIDEDMFLVKY